MVNFDNDFMAKYHKVLAINELGDSSLSEDISKEAYRISWAGTKESGYSFGPCQWDLKNPNRIIYGTYTIANLFESLIYNEIPDKIFISENVTSKVYKVKGIDVSKLKSKLTYNGKSYILLELINKALSSNFGKNSIDKNYIDELRTQIKYIDERIENVLITNSKIKEFLNDEYIKLSLLDYHNQFNLEKVGKCIKYLKGEKIQKYNSSAIIQIGNGTKIDDWRNYYYSTKYGTTDRDDLERRQANIEKIVKFSVGEKTETKSPQNFQDALKTMFPPLKIAKDRLLSVSWVGYKFTNLYQLTQEECKKEEADIVKIAKNKFKEEKRNLNLIKRGEIYQTLIKAGTYEGAIAKDDKDKEINYFYNKEEEARVLGSVKLAYGHSYHGLNFINPTIYSPINGKIYGADERNLIIEETHKSQEEVKYLHYFKNVFNSKLSVGDEIKVGEVLGQIGQASKDFDDINLTYSINKIDVKVSEECIRIDPVEFWTTGKHKGVSFKSINEGLKSIVLGKFGEMKENDNGKKETHLIHSLNENEGRNMPILVDGYKIGHYAKKLKEFSYEEKEIIFNRKELKLENNGLAIGYEYVPLDKVLLIRAGGKPKLTIKNFVNGNHGIYLEGLVTTGNQINLFAENNKEEQSDSKYESKKGSASGSGGEKYIGHGAKASCPLGGQITLKALNSPVYSDGKMLLDSSHKAPNINICGSGTCSAVKPHKCNPVPVGSWLMTSPKFMIGCQSALTDKSMIGCALGGIIRINDTAQKSFGYGSVEAKLLADKSKEDEKAIKNQQEGKEAKEKIMTVVTVLRKTEMDGYKKTVEVEELLSIQWNEFFKVNYENKEYKLVNGLVKNSSDTTLFSICGFANDKENKALLSENSYEIVLDDKKVYKIGEFQIIDSSNKKAFYESNKNLTLGSSISVNNDSLVVIEHNKAVTELNKSMNVEAGEKGTVVKVKLEVQKSPEIVDLSGNSIIKNIRNNKTLKLSESKKDSLCYTANALLNNNFEPEFIAGILGNIMAEGEYGLFESSNYKNPERLPKYFKYMKEHLKDLNYDTEFSGKKISSVGLKKTCKLVDFTVKNNYQAKFGFGAAQFTGDRATEIIKKYIEVCGNVSKTVIKSYKTLEKSCEGIFKEKEVYPTPQQMLKAESDLIVEEIKGVEKKCYKTWKSEHKNKDNSVNMAGQTVCKEYERPYDGAQAIIRGKNADSIYKVMMKNN